MNNKIDNKRLQRSWNYRQINSIHYNKNYKKILLKLIIPLIFFVLIFGNISSNASNSKNIEKKYHIKNQKLSEELNRKIEKLFINNGWYEIAGVLDDIPDNYKNEDLINFCKGIKGSFVQIGDKNPIIYFESIKPESKFFVLSRLMLLKYRYNLNQKSNSEKLLVSN